MFSGLPLSYSRWQPGARRSHILMVPSSEPVYIHLPSRWKPAAVMLFVWPSYELTAFGELPLMSKMRSEGLPAAAMYCLSGEISSLFTCESGCCIVL